MITEKSEWIPKFRLFVLALACVCLLGFTACDGRQVRHGGTEKSVLLVAVASNALPALEEIGAGFQQETGHVVNMSGGASGILARQIREGAPFDLFLSADSWYTTQLSAEGLLVPETVAVYARGRLVVAIPTDSDILLESVLELPTAAELDGRVAIANPVHAPYGMAAREFLTATGLWDSYESKLVLGENVGNVRQYLRSGNVALAILPLSLAITGDESYQVVPEEYHAPIEQSFGVLASSESPALALEFGEYLRGVESREILGRYGFVVPDQTTGATK